MHPVAGVDTLEFVDLHWPAMPLSGTDPIVFTRTNPFTRASVSRVSRIVPGAASDSTLSRYAWRCRQNAKVDEIFPLVLDGNDDRTRIDSDPDFKKHSELTPNFGGPSERCLLHVERGVARSDGVVFKSNGRPEAGHDPVALLAGNPLILVNDVDHGVDGRFQDPASVLRIAVSINAVELAMSAKRTVTIFRSPSCEPEPAP